MKTTLPRFAVGVTLAAMALANPASAADKPKSAATAKLAEQNKACVECHQKTSPALVMEWQRSRHAEGALNPKAPFEHEVQWVFGELWHHEGRRARHGASMMGPDYTHWHGMYEVSKHFYEKFLPAVIAAATARCPELGKQYEAKVQQLLTKEEHRWRKGLSPAEIEALQKSYKDRYNQ